MLTKKQINQYAKEIYKANKERGWWDDPDRCFYQTLQLVNTEIAEATEADRKGLQDDHLPHRLGAEVELADTFIRMADLAGRYSWKFVEFSKPDHYLESVTTLGARHFILTKAISTLGTICLMEESTTTPQVSAAYSVVIRTILRMAEQENYDLKGAIDEKLEFNAKRRDHDREVRAGEGGKKY